MLFLVPIHSGCCPTAPGVTTKHNCNKDEDNPTEAAQAKLESSSPICSGPTANPMARGDGPVRVDPVVRHPLVDRQSLNARTAALNNSLPVTNYAIIERHHSQQHLHSWIILSVSGNPYWHRRDTWYWRFDEWKLSGSSFKMNNLK